MTIRLPNRNIFNSDSTYLFFDPQLYNRAAPPDAPYTARVIDDHIDLLADCGIDTHLCNPQASAAWWPSKRIASVLTGYRRGDREFVRSQCPADGIIEPAAIEKHCTWLSKALDRMLDLQDTGVDWLAQCARGCRRRGISPWVTVRMNDVHGASVPTSFFNCPLWHDSANRLSGRHIWSWPGCEPWQWPYFAGLNCALPTVRHFYLNTIGELVEDYDNDGLELDWLRNPICCEPGATAEQAAMMLDFHRQVRALGRAKEKRTGRRYAVGLRIPPNFGLLRDIGLDIHAIVGAGLVDFLSISNFWQTSWDLPYDEYRREFGDEITLYGVIEAAPNWVQGYTPAAAPSAGEITSSPTFSGASVQKKSGAARRGTRYSCNSPEILRANAAGKLAMGCDGLEYFNFFAGDADRADHLDPFINYRPLGELPDLRALRGKPKHYALSSMFGMCWIPPYEATEQLPVVLRPRWRRDFRLSMAAEPPGAPVTFAVQLVVERQAAYPALGVSFNGRWPIFESTQTNDLLIPTYPFTRHVPEHQAFRFRLDPSGIREGWNTITVFNSAFGGTAESDARDAVCLVSLELAVKPC